MTIQSGDVKLIASQVMLDVPEGGGAPTSNVIADGVSNAVFPDISELDRAGGRVNLRKVFASVQTNDTDSYLGANVIVAEPPKDPNVSVTLFSTNDQFDRRTNAKSRLEAYLSVGTMYTGYLLGNHIAGQNTLIVYQRSTEVPAVGATLVLTKREGFSDQFVQYVRVIEVSMEQRTFEDSRGVFTKQIVTMKLGNTLLQDFPGFDVTREDATKAQIAAATKISATVVANAARYYGVTPLETAVAIGDFSAKGKSLFTQLVPSAQIETPIADSRTNQLSAAVLTTGTTATQSIAAVFTTAQNLYVGGAIVPGSFSIAAGGVTVTDSGGNLVSAGSQVGFIDYENGLLSLSTNVFGTSSQTFSVTYQQGVVAQTVNQSQGFAVTIENRALSYIRTIEPAPVRGTLAVSYMSQGRWYVLRDDGSGVLRGGQSGYGVGNLNFTTGTVAVTLGALPDVGSSLIFTWVEPAMSKAANEIATGTSSKLYWPLNSDGGISEQAGSKAFQPGQLAITWNDGTARTVTDNGAGALTGDGTGTVNYAAGTLKLSPNVLPPAGTLISVSVKSALNATMPATYAGGLGNLGATNITPGSVQFTLNVQRLVKYKSSPFMTLGTPEPFGFRDDGNGKLLLSTWYTTVVCGTIDYAAGTFTLNDDVTVTGGDANAAVRFDSLYRWNVKGGTGMIAQA